MINLHTVAITQTKLLRFPSPHAIIPLKRHREMCLWLDVKKFVTFDAVYFSSLEICRGMYLK